jgi:hypothetical protein
MRGGKRPGAGRPKGTPNRPHILDHWTPEDVLAYFAWLKKAYKKNPRIATWIGDQISGKAAQPLTGDKDNPVYIAGVNVRIRK